MGPKGFPKAAIGILCSLCLGAAFGQTAPPAELNLKGKVRDFIEANPTRTPVHPHFYGAKPHQPGCSSQEAGVNIVQADIDTANALGDTGVFKGDNRGPKVAVPLDPKVAQCFDPVDRFSDWYNDRPGDVNRAFLIEIKFTRNPASGVYEYFDDNFFPIDSGKTFTRLGPNPPFGHLLPGADAAHDYGFTMEFHANFTYFKGKAQTFTFRGDDDVWVFINGKRVIDLGGIHAAQDASFGLDSVAASIGLQDSLVYPLDFFFAERHTTTSKLRITTTLELEPLLAKPTLTPGRFFEGRIAVVAAHPSPAVTLYYTTDGSMPTAASQKYTGPITLSATATVKVIAVRPGWRTSEVVSETYARRETVATPTADPEGRLFVNPMQVALADATPGAVIHYTLDGTNPDSASPVYAGPLTFTATTTLKARAYRADWVASAVMTEVYTDAGTLVPPVADPRGGGFTGSRTVSLSVPGFPQASIRYTLDGSEPAEASPLYVTPLIFTGNAVLKAKAFQQDWKPSQTMTETYERLAVAVNAAYLDENGDGRIDMAVIRLDMVPSGVPASVSLIDPFTRAPVVFPSSYITPGAAPDVLSVRFPDRPFTFGTAFATAPLGSFPAAPGFGPQAFPVSDSVGPVPVKAVSRNKTTPEMSPSVDITFSESIDLAPLQGNPSGGEGLAWPFDILRPGALPGLPAIVTAIEAVPGAANTYRWTFLPTTPVYPVFTDSLTLAVGPKVRDALGNPGVPHGIRIPVEGAPVIVNNPMAILVTNPIVKENADNRTDLPAEITREPFAIVVKDLSATTCLTCPPGTENLFNPRQALPEWVIKSKYAFHYDFTIYDHLGNYINKTRGQVNDAMIGKIPVEKDGYRSVRFRWIPVAHNGAAVGTGAYILKGVVLNHLDEQQKGSQGETQVVRQSQTAVFATFGYLRQN